MRTDINDYIIIEHSERTYAAGDRQTIFEENPAWVQVRQFSHGQATSYSPDHLLYSIYSMRQATGCPTSRLGPLKFFDDASTRGGLQ